MSAPRVRLLIAIHRILPFVVAGHLSSQLSPRSHPIVRYQRWAPCLHSYALSSRSAISGSHAAFHGGFPDFDRYLLVSRYPFATCLARVLPHGTCRRRKGQRCFPKTFPDEGSDQDVKTFRKTPERFSYQDLLRFPPLRSRQNPCAFRFTRRKTKGANRR